MRRLVGVCRGRGRLCILRVLGVEGSVCLHRHLGVQAIARAWDDHHRAISRADLRRTRTNLRARDIHRHRASLRVFPDLYVHPVRFPLSHPLL
ncbi:hypothetical protein HAV15_006589 [Penicillium sp. str. |nr:hypothetical protein HAV15_006589 [Penicillium sp. str. \